MAINWFSIQLNQLGHPEDGVSMFLQTSQKEIMLHSVIFSP
jgi:hypothetical protein